jgi:hypothetical protein
VWSSAKKSVTVEKKKRNKAMAIQNKFVYFPNDVFSFAARAVA